MTAPLSDERLAEIDEIYADYKNRCGAPGRFKCCSAHPVADAVPELRAEVERLRAELADAHHDIKLCVGDRFTTLGSAAVEAIRRVAVAEANRDRLAEQVEQLRALTQKWEPADSAPEDRWDRGWDAAMRAAAQAVREILAAPNGTEPGA